MDSNSEIFKDSDIPTAMEVVMASVKTGQPTIIHRNVPIQRQYKESKVLYNPIIKPKVRISKFKRPDVSKAAPQSIVFKTITPKEELVKLTKTSESDSDVDIDIEDEDVTLSLFNPTRETEVNDNVDIPSTSVNSCTATSPISYPEDAPPGLLDMKTPLVETILNIDVITDEEQYFNVEFFEGRSAKTPERYLKIRNHILNYWSSLKPNYVTKTAVRLGLKSCGDVNSIGRIHLYLEQIGAINFGCLNVQYIRPLVTLCIKQDEAVQPKQTPKFPVDPPKKYEHIGQRNKKKIFMMEGEGGCTFMHNEQGEIIETNIISTEKRNKPKPMKKELIQLIACNSFSDKHKAPYDLKIEISALLTMDWHAHTSLNEVMGLLGGKLDNEKKTLYVKKYVPCRSSTNSATHCDMCPVSQSAASETIQSLNLDVIGWFHSHPTFSPNPSQQDLETQIDMQQFVVESSTFLGIILSPFSKFVSSHVSEYRCLVIKYLLNEDNCTKETPFKFHPQVIASNLDVAQLMEDAMFMFISNINLDLDAPYLHNPEVTYLEKILDSTKTHLLECGVVDQPTVNHILTDLKKILLNCDKK